MDSGPPSRPISTPILRKYAGEVLPGLWVGNLSSVEHLDVLAQESTNIVPASTDNVTVSVISILAAPGLIRLVTNSLERQRRLQNDDSTNDAKDERTLGLNNMDINHTVISLRDNVDSDLSAKLPEALAAIDEALRTNEPRICLVHCAKGESRSVSVLVAYLLSRHSHAFGTFDDALRQIRNVRPQARPNSGFEAELRRMERNSAVE
jgi:protein-tyrosine phosphatase